MMTKHRKYIERLTIYGNRDERERATKYCHDNDFRIIRAGPKRLPGNIPDYNRFKIVAEAELKSAPDPPPPE
jgi:hypothetical protein